MSDYRDSDDEISENFSNGESTLQNDDTKSEIIVPTIDKMYSEKPQNPLLYNTGKNDNLTENKIEIELQSGKLKEDEKGDKSKSEVTFTRPSSIRQSIDNISTKLKTTISGIISQNRNTFQSRINSFRVNVPVNEINPEIFINEFQRFLVQQTFYGALGTDGTMESCWKAAILNQNSFISIFTMHELDPFSRTDRIYIFALSTSSLFFFSALTAANPSDVMEILILIVNVIIMHPLRIIFTTMLVCPCLYSGREISDDFYFAKNIFECCSGCIIKLVLLTIIILFIVFGMIIGLSQDSEDHLFSIFFVSQVFDHTVVENLWILLTVYWSFEKQKSEFHLKWDKFFEKQHNVHKDGNKDADEFKVKFENDDKMLHNPNLVSMSDVARRCKELHIIPETIHGQHTSLYWDYWFINDRWAWFLKTSWYDKIKAFRKANNAPILKDNNYGKNIESNI